MSVTSQETSSPRIASEVIEEYVTAPHAAPESSEVFFDVIPWAHVYHEGRRLATTPMRASLRLPAGNQTLGFRHPAFPEITMTQTLRAGSDTVHVKLADHAAVMEIVVEPWGEIFLDGERIGSSPLTRPTIFLPGIHNLLVTHPTLSAVEQQFDAARGDTLTATADLDHGIILIRQSKTSTGVP